jgi:hypothetical protein
MARQLPLTKATSLKPPHVAKKEKEMKNSIKLLASVAFAAVLGVAPAIAQMQTTLKAHVPFDFVVKGKLLPAGDYTVTERADSPLIAFHNTSSEESVIVMMGWHVDSANSDDSKLVFHRAGNRHYLAAVRTAGESYDRVAIKSKAEREAEGAVREPVVASIKAVRQ